MSLLFQANHSFSFKVHPPSSPQDLARSTLLSLASVFRQFFSPGSFLLLSEQKRGKETFILLLLSSFTFPVSITLCGQLGSPETVAKVEFGMQDVI